MNCTTYKNINDIKKIVFNLTTGSQEQRIIKYNRVMWSLIERFATFTLYKEYSNIIDSCLASLKFDNILIDYQRIDSIDNTRYYNKNGFMGFRSTFTLQWHPRVGLDTVRVLVISRDFIHGNYKINGFGSEFNENNLSIKGYHLKDIHSFNIDSIVNIKVVESLNELHKFFDWGQVMDIDSGMSENDPKTWDTFLDTILSWTF